MPKIRNLLATGRPLHWISADSSVMDAIRTMVRENATRNPNHQPLDAGWVRTMALILSVTEP